MMTGRQLFRRRFVEEWKFQWKVLRSVFDWSVILYVVVPALIIAPFVYIEMWQDIHLYWSEEIPFSILIGLILILFIIGNFRTFLLEADLLFLMQRKKLIYQLKLSGFLYSVLRVILSTALMFIVILPILVFIYDFLVMDISFLFIAVIAFRLSFLSLKKIITRTVTKWIVFPAVFMVSHLLILNMNSMMLAVGSLLVIGFVCYFHMTQFVKTNRHFLQELAIEQSERVRYIKLILNFSQEVEKPPVKQGKRPMLFRNSGRFFQVRSKENGLLEFLLKAFLRNKGYMASYSQLVGLSLFGIIVLPVWLKWIVFLCFIFFVNTWIKNIYREMMDSAFFAVVPYGDEELSDAVRPRFRRWIVIPSAVFVGGLSFLLSFIEFFS
ncbi:ABC transporter permease [Virgibacillus sp. NKC19-16]|uniref:ABC transporter permease n=1 Tax=Virgibacillus salidurans TaxID=2831673 RepID=UPI001F3E80F4|nr:ABC transporter permease [Virgibacillus sp. NKC19-16]UJL45238.1 ABC transporter permease [Virgibacillus sp. NKC19-16]